jgi:alkylated DNA repair dioxygenase AlkB
VKTIDPPTITITFGDVAENHVGMQKLGVEAPVGFSLEDLQFAEKYFKERGNVTELHFLNDCLNDLAEPNHSNFLKESLGELKDNSDIEKAYLLVIRKATDNILLEMGKTTDDMKSEQLSLKWDTQALMKGEVKNKIARHNLCYGHEYQAPDYPNGKGTVIAFDTVPYLNYIRTKLPDIIGEKAKGMVAEGNLYYDTNRTYISAHGDKERRLVIAVRLGETIPLYYQWYHRFEKVGRQFKVDLNHGDMYIMSSKAVGKDWLQSSKYTLRHAAGKEHLFS